MGEARFMISDAARQVGVETHVLRNWEEELDIEVGRTELGHRYYTEKTIHMFQKVKELREKGFQLKAIKVLVPQIQRKEDETEGERHGLRQKGTKDEHEVAEMKELPVPVDLDKLEKFEEIVGMIVKQALQENNLELENRISDTVVREMELLMQIREEKEEERYRNLDETIRLYQKNRQLVAAARADGGPGKWFHIFKKRG